MASNGSLKVEEGDVTRESSPVDGESGEGSISGEETGLGCLDQQKTLRGNSTSGRQQLGATRREVRLMEEKLGGG